MKTKFAIVAALAVLGASWPLLSQQPAPLTPPAPVAKAEEPGAAAPQPSSPPLEAADLGAWLDGYLPASLERAKIAGAVVSVVKDGQTLLVRGYGHADVKAKTPMDGNRHLMRIGSTSKLFTWTAVMQLVEQGKIDLNRDVNAYLDFKIPQRGGRAVTMNDLMTHRAGFEDGLKNIVITDPARTISYEQFLKDQPRPLILTPGQVPAYSNYGTALAGYIVERVSGETFDDYIERHILKPLRMDHTTFRQPLPARLKADMPLGYMNTTQDPYPFEFLIPRPAGSASATAADMANFMIAHLQDGRFGDAQILKPATARFMHSPSLAHPAGFATMAHGFFHGRNNGRVVIGHGGDMLTFHTDMNLIPSENVGIFVSFTSRGEGDAFGAIRSGLFDDFMDRYFPDNSTQRDPPAIGTAKAHAAEIAGAYDSSRRIESGFFRLMGYILQEKVTANDDGTISLGSAAGKKFREVAPYLWREIGGDQQLQLTRVGGRKTIINSNDPSSALQEVSPAGAAQLNNYLLVAALIVLLWTLVAWPVGWRFRRLYNQPQPLSGRPLLAHRLTRFAALADLAYLAGWAMIILPLTRIELDFYTSAIDPVLRLLQVAAILPIAGAGVGLWNAWLTIRSDRGWRAKAGSLLIAAALLVILWFAFLVGLISFNLNY